MADRALLTAINNYKHISDLRGCVNDVVRVKETLIDVFGFTAANITVLTDGEVTKERLLKGWKWLLKNAAAGDRLVFHFSGHGSHITDLDEDEPDGVDELICLHDMDFDDDQTYLLDDELYDLTAKVPKGAFLTVILDSCHSGTATRMLLAPDGARSAIAAEKAPLVDLRTSMARMPASTAFAARSLAAAPDAAEEAVEHILAPPSLADSRDTVLVRYVEPPPKVLATLRRGWHSQRTGGSPCGQAAIDEPRAAGRKRAHANFRRRLSGWHVQRRLHLSSLPVDSRPGARRRPSRSDPRRPHRTLAGPLHAGAAIGAGRNPRAAVRLERKKQTSSDASSGGSLPTGDTGRDLVRVLTEIRDLLARGTDPGRLFDRAAGSRALVYVHGICRHDAGYSKPWWQALRPHVSSPLRETLEANRPEVLWSDLVTATRAVALSPQQQAEEQALAEQIRETLEDRAAREAVAAAPLQPAGAAPQPANVAAARGMLGIPGLDCIDDFVKYLVSDSIRSAVQQRFLDVVVPLLTQGAVVDVVSHSWGTVVAYEALRTLDGRAFSGRVRNLFTVGSALSIALVKNRLRPRDGRRPSHVDRWVNLDARGDIVGGPMQGNPFAVDVEFLNLFPTGCDSFLGQVSPSCADSSYFHRDNVPVNRDIFARHIEM